MVTAAEEGIGAALERLGGIQPSAPALQARGRKTLSYADLAAQIRDVRRRLAEWGIVPGDIVAGFVASRPEMMVACATLPPSLRTLPRRSAGRRVAGE